MWIQIWIIFVEEDWATSKPYLVWQSDTDPTFSVYRQTIKTYVNTFDPPKWSGGGGKGNSANQSDTGDANYWLSIVGIMETHI